jgi:hypothetical protein
MKRFGDIKAGGGGHNEAANQANTSAAYNCTLSHLAQAARVAPAEDEDKEEEEGAFTLSPLAII